jgi:hypothetical protein
VATEVPRGLRIQIRVTAGPNNGDTLRLALAAKSVQFTTDSDDFAYIDIPSGSYATPAIFELIVMPGCSTAPESAAAGRAKTYALPLANSIKLSVVHSGAGSWTYAVAACFLR